MLNRSVARLALRVGLALWAGLAPLLALLASSGAALAQEPTRQLPEREMVIIAHRGASAERPEHTLAAYEKAIDEGADFIEPDLVPTKDGVLVARHENEISGTTDVADHAEFADRRRTKEVDGRPVSGWFVEDFTLAELRTLRARERLPAIRPGNARYDGLYQVPTLAEIVALIRAREAETGRTIGLYPELKHPTFLLQAEGIDTVDLLLAQLTALGIGPDDAIYIQSFDIAPLRRLNQRSDYRLVQLIAAQGGPADEPDLTYAQMASAVGLADVARYADAVGPDLALVLEDDGLPAAFVTAAHQAGLPVHAWALRPENAFLPAQLRGPGGDSAPGDAAKLLRLLMRAGIDGIFTDAPALAVAVRTGERDGAR